MLAAGDFSPPREAADDDRLRRVIDFLFAHYREDITLGEVSAVAFLTPPAFCRFFKKRTGKSFFNFLNEFRVNQACQLLISGDTAVRRIAREVGFRSLTNFNRMFKKLKGETPTGYRRGFRG